MKILEIVHGYPPSYNAGSENYTEAVVNELSRKGQVVSVFCREENQFQPEFKIIETKTTENGNIRKYIVNVARVKDRFLNSRIDEALGEIVEDYRPDVAHIEHLNHLSLGIPEILKEKGIPMVYTLHDFWLMCPRGQFLQFNLDGEPWRHCDGQDDSKCATICYARYQTGDPGNNNDIEYWTSWVKSRMNYAKKAVDYIDKFIAPSQTVLKAFVKTFPKASEKVTYLDYGFDLTKLKNRKRKSESPIFVFGYIGTHIPAKGIDYLLRAFARIRGNSILRIWGRPRGDYTPYLKSLSFEIEQASGNRVQWMGEFDGNKIVEQVFNKVDAIVVPSIWLENSPLVIHEAQQARVPVITANIGGMAEYIKHEVNGLLFRFRDVGSLANQMQKLMDDPFISIKLGQRGYLYSENGDVQSINTHVDKLIEIFKSLSRN